MAGEWLLHPLRGGAEAVAQMSPSGWPLSTARRYPEGSLLGGDVGDTREAGGLVGGGQVSDSLRDGAIRARRRPPMVSSVESFRRNP